MPDQADLAQEDSLIDALPKQSVGGKNHRTSLNMNIASSQVAEDGSYVSIEVSKVTDPLNDSLFSVKPTQYLKPDNQTVDLKQAHQLILDCLQKNQELIQTGFKRHGSASNVPSEMI